jgi:hypothetical protein
LGIGVGVRHRYGGNQVLGGVLIIVALVIRALFSR